LFKAWQIFVFSLIPLALAFMGVIGGSVRGHGGGHAEVFPTPSAPPPASASGSTPGGATGPGVITVVAKNTAFDKRALNATANSEVTIHFDNQDAGVVHNISFYTKSDGKTKIPGATGNLITGPSAEDLKFTAPTAGTYYFRCDAHPDQMNGSFTVR
jgi:plastocyanin